MHNTFVLSPAERKVLRIIRNIAVGSVALGAMSLGLHAAALGLPEWAVPTVSAAGIGIYELIRKEDPQAISTAEQAVAVADKAVTAQQPPKAGGAA